MQTNGLHHATRSKHHLREDGFICSSKNLTSIAALLSTFYEPFGVACDQKFRDHFIVVLGICRRCASTFTASVFWQHATWHWETDFYTPPVLGGAALFDNSAPAVYEILCPKDSEFYTPPALNCWRQFPAERQRCSVSKLFLLQLAVVYSICHRWLNPPDCG